ncbi:MAG: hypothetical protein JO329_04310 [Planctomycetaceae bacterium]|nr:hypothetical protein [Planctomycetaceae bacterium]
MASWDPLASRGVAPEAAPIGEGFIGPIHAEAPRRMGVGVVELLDSPPDRARPLAER